VKENTVTRIIGNVFEDSTEAWEFEAKSKEELKKLDLQTNPSLPFQIQITYYRLDGMKCIRTLTETKSITFDKKVAQESLDYGILAMHNNVQSAKLAQQGLYMDAVDNNQAMDNLMAANMKTEQQQSDYSTFTNTTTEFNQQMIQEQVRSPQFQQEQQFQQQQQQQFGFGNFTYESPVQPQASPQMTSPQPRTDQTANMIFKFKNTQQNKRLYKK